MTTPWSVPPLWKGLTVWVLASGPSMNLRTAQRARRSGHPAAVTNDTYRLAPWAALLYAADAAWWRANPEARRFAGIKVCADDSLRGADVCTLRHTGKVGFDPDPRCIRTGGNSGYQAVHVAIQAGAARILLCGFDMHGAHWFGQHDKGLMNTPPEKFALWRERFDALNGHGAEIINCTPGSALTCFPRADVRDFA